MSSLTNAVQTAIFRKKVPAFNPGSTHDLAQGLGMPFPVSVQDLLGTLDNLSPASVTFDSGPFTVGFVHGSAYLFLQSDGGYAWGGKVHESGAVGDNFRFAVALLDVKDAAGNVLVFVHEDTIVGQLDVGFSDKEWNDFGIDQLIADNWEQAKTTRLEFKLEASTDPLQVVETVFVIAGIVVAAIFAGNEACPEGNWKCGWRLLDQRTIPGDPRESPSFGAEYNCRCESD